MPTVLITGAGRGLGLELARQYAADGWSVIGTVRNEASRKALEALGARSHRLDVTDFDAVKQLGEHLRGERIDVLVCNAGITGRRMASRAVKIANATEEAPTREKHDPSENSQNGCGQSQSPENAPDFGPAFHHGPRHWT